MRDKFMTCVRPYCQNSQGYLKRRFRPSHHPFQLKCCLNLQFLPFHFRGKSLHLCQSPEQFQSSLSASDGTPVPPTHTQFSSFSLSFQGFLHNGVFQVNLYCRCRHLMVLPKERGEDKAKVRIAISGEKNCSESFATTCRRAKSFRLCPTVFDPIDYSLPGCSVHGILQVRILEWVAMPSSKESSQPRDQTHVFYVSCIGRQVLYQQHNLGSP